MFLVGWLALACGHRRRSADLRSADLEDRSWRTWLPAVAFAIALSAGDVAFLASTRRIPAAQASILTYLWPIMIVVFGACLGLFRVRRRQVAGLALGFGGAVILMWDGHVSASPSGIALAMLNGALWAGYCVFRLIWKRPAGRFLARGCALSAGLCALLHLLLEPTVMPGPGAMAATAAAGILPLALGNVLWDEGFRRGDSQLLAVMAYATPLCSALLLAALGAALFTWNLLVGAVVIVIAGMLARTDLQDSAGRRSV